NFEKLLGFDRPFGLQTFSNYLFGQNLVVSNGNEWIRHRTVTRQAFAKPLRPSLFGKSVTKLIAIFHNKLSDNKSVDMYSWMQRLTLDVLGRGIFSFDFTSLNDDDGGPYVKLWNTLMVRIANPLYLIFPLWVYVPTPYNLKVWNDCKRFRQLMLGIINERKDDQAAGKIKEDKEKDLLDMMIDAAKEDVNSKWTSEDVMYNLSVFFVAGHDTTANVLSAAIYFMARYKEIQDHAREEVYSVIGKPKNIDDAMNVFPDLSQLSRMIYLTALMKEATRLYPSATTIGVRKAIKDLDLTYKDLNGVEKSLFIPKGSLATLDIFGMHHDPGYYNDPTRFNPDRWIGEKNDGDDIKSYIPFGGGARICAGMQFSLMEQKVALSMLLRNFEFYLIPLEDGTVPAYKTGSTGLLRPEGLRVGIRPISFV
ncbi:hypothetical protein HK096_004712, partial [Nowakowskiella sp. JEL0078]